MSWLIWGKVRIYNLAILLSYSSDTQFIKTMVIAQCDEPDVLDHEKCTNV